MGKRIVLYTKEHCPLCEKAHKLLCELQEDAEVPGFVLDIQDIYKNDDLLEKYMLMIPVITVDGIEAGYGQFDKNELKKALTNF